MQSWVSILLAVYGAALLASSPVFGKGAGIVRRRQLPLTFEQAGWPTGPRHGGRLSWSDSSCCWVPR